MLWWLINEPNSLICIFLHSISRHLKTLVLISILLEAGLYLTPQTAANVRDRPLIEYRPVLEHLLYTVYQISHQVLLGNS